MRVNVAHPGTNTHGVKPPIERGQPPPLAAANGWPCPCACRPVYVSLSTPIGNYAEVCNARVQTQYDAEA